MSEQGQAKFGVRVVHILYPRVKLKCCSLSLILLDLLDQILSLERNEPYVFDRTRVSILPLHA